MVVVGVVNLNVDEDVWGAENVEVVPNEKFAVVFGAPNDKDVDGC